MKFQVGDLIECRVTSVQGTVVYPLRFTEDPGMTPGSSGDMFIKLDAKENVRRVLQRTWVHVDVVTALSMVVS